MKHFILRPDIAFISIVLIAGYLLFYRLGDTALVNWDEATLASVAQDMVARQDFFTGYWNGQIWMYEPPLLTWVLAAVMSLTGPAEFWLRAINATGGLIMVILTYWLGKKVTGTRLGGGISSLILLSDIEFLFRARQINVEIPLTLFLLLTLTFLTRFDNPRFTKTALAAAVCLGLAFLSKRASPVLALPTVGYLLLRSNDRRRLVIFVIVLIAVILPWHIYSYLKLGNQFINEYFVGYTLGKIKAANSDFGTSYLFYLGALKHAFKFWTIVLPPAILWVIIRIMPRISSIHHINPLQRLMYSSMIIWIMTFFVLLTLAPIKASWYLLPIHPVLAVLVGSFIVSVTKHRRRLSLIAVAAAMTISGSQIIKWRRDYIVPDTTSGQATIAKRAHDLSQVGETIYLDDDYLPVAVFYSQRKVEALRFNRLVTQKPSLTQLPTGSLVMSNTGTFEVLKENLSSEVEVIHQEADLLLLRVLPITSAKFL